LIDKRAVAPHHSPQTLLKTEEECFIENLTDTQLGFSRSVCVAALSMY
jgi:hypothetical protein